MVVAMAGIPMGTVSRQNTPSSEQPSMLRGVEVVLRDLREEALEEIEGQRQLDRHVDEADAQPCVEEAVLHQHLEREMIVSCGGKMMALNSDEVDDRGCRGTGSGPGRERPSSRSPSARRPRPARSPRCSRSTCRSGTSSTPTRTFPSGRATARRKGAALISEVVRSDITRDPEDRRPRQHRVERDGGQEAGLAGDRHRGASLVLQPLALAEEPRETEREGQHHHEPEGGDRRG